MTLVAAFSAFTSILALLANSAPRILALSGAVGLGLTAFRIKAPTPRLLVWTAVLYAALAMPFLQWALPTVLVRTPAFLRSAVAAERPSSGSIVRSAPLSRVDRDQPARGEKARIAASPKNSPPFKTSPGTSLLSSIPWSAVTAGIYFAVAVLLLGRFCVGLAFGRRLRQAAQCIDDPRVTARIS
jgi:hypothetical protein